MNEFNEEEKHALTVVFKTMYNIIDILEVNNFCIENYTEGYSLNRDMLYTLAEKLDIDL